MNISSALLIDFYQLTMSQGYWRLGMAEREAVFYLFYRKCPFEGHFVVNAGLESVIDTVQKWSITREDIDYLRNLQDSAHQPIFCAEFLNYLQNLRLSCDIFAVREGQLIFPNEPIIRVKGPILQCQLLETLLVNQINFAALIATKAARVCAAAQDDPVIEFGLRRAQGPNGGLTASRSAYIGGCNSVSNTLAGKNYHIPVKGTMAHSWIMAFDTELNAFQGFADIMPSHCVLLVDTYDTLQGVQHAITVGEKLRAQGKDLLGIRLDSGDLYMLSCQARELLNAAGFHDTKIMASGDLDEYLIADLKRKGAPIDQWGVGTRMTTSYDYPSLDMAYKLSAIRDEQGVWQYKMKRSDQPGKTTTPGILQTRRFYNSQWLTDIIYDIELGIASSIVPQSHSYEDLLQPIFQQGHLIYQKPQIQEIQQFCRQQLQDFNQRDHYDFSVQFEPHLQAIKDKFLSEYNTTG